MLSTSVCVVSIEPCGGCCREIVYNLIWVRLHTCTWRSSSYTCVQSVKCWLVEHSHKLNSSSTDTGNMYKVVQTIIPYLDHAFTFECSNGQMSHFTFLVWWISSIIALISSYCRLRWKPHSMVEWDWHIPRSILTCNG